MIRPLVSLALPGGPSARLPILIWHRVLPQPDPLFPDEMHAARFDQVLGWLGRHFQVMALGDAVEWLRRGSLPPRALAITFDDGYADNLQVAEPILRKHGMRATFFIASGFLHGGRMWNDTVIETVRHWPAGELDAGAFGRYAVNDPRSRRAAIDALLERIKYLDFDERDRAVAELASRCDGARQARLMMTPDELRALAAGQEIGAHTRFHPILARLPAEQARREIEDGKRELEDLLGRPVDLFAYPNGRPQRDYSDRDVAMVREAGFRAAVSTAAGASGAGDDLFQLRRFTPWDAARLRFLLRLLANARLTAPPPVVAS